MTHSKNTHASDKEAKTTVKQKKDPKADRLAEALRANLRKRKQAAKRDADES